MGVPAEIKLTSETAARLKLETNYAQDAAPTVADNGVKILTGLSYTRLAGSRPTDDRADPHFGARGEMKGSHYSEIGFSTYIDGVAAGGDLPSVGALLEACGMTKTVVADTSATYNPVQRGHKSATIWVDMAGELHKAVGARGSVKFSGTLGEPLKAEWSLQALEGADPANADFPGIGAINNCLPALSGDDTTCTLAGIALDLNAFEIDMGVQVQYIDTTQGKSIRITQRSITGSITILKPDLADFNYRVREKDPCAVMPLHVAHAGIEFDCASASMGIVTETDINGAAGIQIPLTLKRTTGNDDLLIKFGVAA